MTGGRLSICGQLMSAELPSYTICVVLAATSNSLRPYQSHISINIIIRACVCHPYD